MSYLDYEIRSFGRKPKTKTLKVSQTEAAETAGLHPILIKLLVDAEKIDWEFNSKYTKIVVMNQRFRWATRTLKKALG